MELAAARGLYEKLGLHALAESCGETADDWP
jgi:hypothetical protein